MEIIHHYPPELLSLLVDTIPLLHRSKKDVITFFRGAGVPRELFADYQQIVATRPATVNKYEIVREILVRVNDRGERTLRERREILKRVIEYEDFSTCWPDDQLKAKGLVGEIRRVVDVKDSFGRMRQEQEAERRQRLAEQKEKLDTLNRQRRNVEAIKRDLYALFAEPNAQRRGKQLEDVLNRLFAAAGISVREAFARVETAGQGIVEQIDGVIELDGEIYLVEMKWWEKPLGNAEVAQHLVRVFSRHCARGLLISYSGYTDPAIATCRDALARMLVVLCDLKEIVRLLEREGDIREFLRRKVRAAVTDKNPFDPIYD